MTKQINDGGPAFPLPDVFRPDGVHISGGASGMSLRDYFAGQALVGLLAHDQLWRDGLMARRAYEFADVMLAARERREGEP